MNYSDNYNFKLPEDSDFAKVSDINDNFELLDDKLKEIEEDGGGSIINITTDDTEFIGLTVTLTDGISSMTGTFGEDKKCTFTGVQMVGTLTATVRYGGVDYSASVNTPYYSIYDLYLHTGEAFTINISTPESTLHGKTITVTNGTKTKTATFGNDGTASMNINFSGAVTLTSTDGTETASKTITVVSGTSTYTVRLAFVQIYGVEWDGSSSQTWTRTDASENFTDPTPAVNNGTGSSPFDDLYPWNAMEKVTDAEAGVCVKIPKFYYKLTQTGTTLKLQIADGEEDGFSVCPACADRGDGNGERDYVLVGRYHCGATNYKSATGVKPEANHTRADFRSSIHGLGSKIWQYDISTHITIWMLYLVEFANWDSQKKIGYGCSVGGSATENMGATDAMQYHTGTNAADRTTYGHVQYRNIEDLWGNVLDWCDGIYFSDTNIYITKNPSSFSDTSGGTLVGTRVNASGYIKSMKVSSVSGFDWFMYPDDDTGASEDTYVGDGCYYDASGVVLFVGGDYGQFRVHGLFYLFGNYAASGANVGIGSRLLKLP